ncbi:MFS transporter [Francisella sp. Scap27]|uniref:MFS transporter n=1 Tax=Francisella sp. Scap27 TaxID=2589986 RepID=UPI0015B968D7|nr:MFS transporter [Francisella sp. Scap27]QLE79381.1 MFS transporter [Francisella sp. Scap27]
MKKFLVLLASSAEWYEFTVYSFCAVYIGDAFFPELSSPFASFLAAFGAFAAGFLARPIGGLIFGYIGDKKSRTTALALAAFFMGVPTVGMALLPSYATIGIFAPLILVIFRISQGIAIGGQSSGSLVILVESESTMYGKSKAGVNFVTSAMGGVLLAIVSFQLIGYFIPEESMANGGWRILFAIAIILVIISFFIKHSKDEEEKPVASNIKLSSTILKNYKSIIFIFVLSFPGSVVAYFQITMLPNIVKQVLGKTNVNVSVLTTISIIVFLIACHISVRLTKYFSIKSVTTFGLILMLVLSLPIYQLYKMNNELLILFFVAMAIVFGVFYGNIMVIFAECLPKEIRYTAFALAYNVGYGVFGGLLPFVCFYLAGEISDYLAIAVIPVSALVGLYALHFLDPNKNNNNYTMKASESITLTPVTPHAHH